jgi:hypothetical protein
MTSKVSKSEMQHADSERQCFSDLGANRFKFQRHSNFQCFSEQKPAFRDKNKFHETEPHIYAHIHIYNTDEESQLK